MTSCPARAQRTTSTWLSATAGALAVVGSLLLWIWLRDSEGRSLRGMPATERAALYQRTAEDLRTACGAGRADDLADHCEQQARFLLKFPECDAACARQAGDILDAR
jgi:hypothetical protein